jgi:hypothetical protein
MLFQVFQRGKTRGTESQFEILNYVITHPASEFEENVAVDSKGILQLESYHRQTHESMLFCIG